MELCAPTSHITGKERDAETALDYFGARYYSSGIARFTRPDPLLNSGWVGNPQSWNRYTYSFNRPTMLIDPTGLYVWERSCAKGDSECRKQQKAFRDALDNLRNAARILKDFAKDLAGAQRLSDVAKAYGTEGQAGVTIGFGATPNGGPGYTAHKDADGNIAVTFDTSGLSDTKGNVNPISFASVVAHEGTHVYDEQQVGANNINNFDYFQKEYRGHQSASYFYEGLYNGLNGKKATINGFEIWNSSWAKNDAQTFRDNGVTEAIKVDQKKLGLPVGDTKPHNPGSN